MAPRVRRGTVSVKSHNERCRECKEKVRNLLTELFGRVETNWDLDFPCQLKDHTNTYLNDILGPIHEALQKFRGFDHFVKSKKLPRVDFFIPDRKLIVEFDESQHFTKPRDIALSLYPPGKNYFGFSVERWRTLCQQLDKQDNYPLYRDEQSPGMRSMVLKNPTQFVDSGTRSLDPGYWNLLIDFSMLI